jgi:hypothetical protein
MRTNDNILIPGNAPGRMAFWKTADPEDCIPFYDFIEERTRIRALTSTLERL